jgi:hypothetical protein
MTCFWDGIMSKLSLQDINNKIVYGSTYVNMTHQKIIELLRRNAVKTVDVMWNGEFLREKEMWENLQWIISYDISKIQQGHDCSICDPFLLVICQLFVINIDHVYNGHLIRYSNKFNLSRKTINFSSDSGHFW